MDDRLLIVHLHSLKSQLHDRTSMSLFLSPRIFKGKYLPGILLVNRPNWGINHLTPHANFKPNGS
jgi:hypothetical protein